MSSSSSDEGSDEATFQCDNCEEVLPRWDGVGTTEKFICVCGRGVCKDCLVRCDECNDDVVVDACYLRRTKVARVRRPMPRGTLVAALSHMRGGTLLYRGL